MAVSKTPFGSTHDGQPVDCYTLANESGVEARIMTYGGTLLSLRVPDRHGQTGDVVLGFATLAPYLEDHPYFGAIIGRYANRIARGHFQLNHNEYQLACNNGRNHLHGGVEGFDRKVWLAHVPVSAAGPQLILRCHSADGDEGYPGNLQVEVSYTLTQAGELKIDYRAKTDAPTIVNLTNHAYFNLDGGSTVLDHRLKILAERYLPVDRYLIPTGELADVTGSCMDFRQPRSIGSAMQGSDEQLELAEGGYDHCWALNNKTGDCTLAAEVHSPASGRRMRVHTTQPGIQVYSGNFLDGTLVGKAGEAYAKHAGLCLETQHFPDSPNQPAFPSAVLMPAETYQHTTIYQFDIHEDT
jgi:aldose 1-epimerase